MKTRYGAPIVIALGMQVACGSGDIPKEFTSSTTQGIVSPAAPEAAATGLEVHYANPRRMTPEEVAALLAVHPARVQPSAEVRRQNFEKAFSALDNWRGGNELDRQKLVLAAVAAAHGLPYAERVVAQAQLSVFTNSGPNSNQ